MYAVIMTGGKQYKVSVDDEIYIEKLAEDAGQDITFDRVIAIGDESGIQTGQKISEASVTGQVIKQGKGKKINIITYKPKKGYRRRLGHRQPYTKVKITAINP